MNTKALVATCLVTSFIGGGVLSPAVTWALGPLIGSDAQITGIYPTAGFAMWPSGMTTAEVMFEPLGAGNMTLDVQPADGATQNPTWGMAWADILNANKNAGAPFAAIGFHAFDTKLSIMSLAGNGHAILPIDLDVGSNNIMHLSTNGNVGIGTSSPKAALEVKGYFTASFPTRTTCDATIKGIAFYETSTDQWLYCRATGIWKAF